MAEEALPEPTETTTETTNTATEDMDLETLAPAPNPKEDADSEPNGVDSAANGESNSKREREEGGESEEVNGGDAKKQKAEKSMEEERLEKLEGGEVVKGEGEEKEKEKEKESGLVSLGPKNFGSSVEMFDYFYKFLHYWPPNLNVNEYEHMVLLELLKKGHAEPDKKIGGGVHAFQVRYHPMWKSRCFFLIRDDESVDDFSFRKCVDQILPLPENMKVKSDVNKALGGSGGGRGGKGGGGGGRGGGRGRGRGGKWRN